jgi:hypothetical protein
VPRARDGARSGRTPSPARPATSPRSRLDEESARSHARGPWLASTTRIGDEELPIATLEEEVGVPLGRSRAGAGDPGAARNSGSSRVTIHASPIGERTGVSDASSASNAATPPRAEIPAHRANASGVAGPKTCRYLRASSRRASRGSTSGAGPSRRSASARRPTGSGPCRWEPRSGTGSDGRRSRAPLHRRSPSRLRGVCATGPRRPPPSSEQRVRPAASRQRRPRGHARRRRTRCISVPRAGRATDPPRWTAPPSDTGVDREERGSRHAVLEAGPRRTPERAGSAWESLIECADVPPEREDLRPREIERRFHRVTFKDEPLSNSVVLVDPVVVPVGCSQNSLACGDGRLLQEYPRDKGVVPTAGQKGASPCDAGADRCS